MNNSGLGFVIGRISEIARKMNRDPADIVIVAASKKVDVGRISEVIKSGVLDIGENKVQEAAGKIEKLGQKVRWHMLGHLQTNKAKKAVESFDIIQSLDSQRLAEALDRHAAAIGKKQSCLIEINIGAEESKYGIKPEELESFVGRVAGLKNIRILGLMTIAPYFEENEKVRPCFKRMKELFDGVQGKAGFENISMKYLSMGMSGDFEIAIEEGSNMVRIGTMIFGERPPSEP